MEIFLIVTLKVMEYSFSDRHNYNNKVSNREGLKGKKKLKRLICQVTDKSGK